MGPVIGVVTWNALGSLIAIICVYIFLHRGKLKIKHLSLRKRVQTINIEDIFEPIKPPPSCGRKLTPGSKISENRVEPEITTNNQPKIFTPNNPV